MKKSIEEKIVSISLILHEECAKNTKYVIFLQKLNCPI